MCSKMANIVFLEAYNHDEETGQVEVPLETLVTYFIYKFCSPDEVNLYFVSPEKDKSHQFFITLQGVYPNFANKVPWQVKTCLFPVVMYEDTIMTGLCAVARHICKHKTHCLSSYEHGDLLGFRGSCLQAPNEASIWTKFCEVDILKTVQEILGQHLKEIPSNLVRFENHLKKPIRIHNIYKIARDLKKENIKSQTKEGDKEKDPKENKSTQQPRAPKPRKWKSNKKKEFELDCSTKIEDLNINHQFAEGPFLTLADLVLLPSYYIIIQALGESIFESLLPLTYKWYINLTSKQNVTSLLQRIKVVSKILSFSNIDLPAIDDVSLYKCDPKRHNPKKRLFTKEDNIEKALRSISQDMGLIVNNADFKPLFNWSDIPDGANTIAGHLPDERVVRKSQQLENLATAVLNIAEDGDLIVDFCSGSGHLGILVAYLLPKCNVILLENKEQSLLIARLRVREMGMQNVYFFQCNLDFFVGKFDIGIALHACGIASDLVLDKCLKANAKFVICPCCYGFLHATDRLVYPRSNKFSCVPIDQYLCIGHAADQTHEEHPLAVRGARCMAVIDSDRACLAEEFGYKISLSRLKPLSCTPKNNLLIGVPL